MLRDLALKWHSTPCSSKVTTHYHGLAWADSPHDAASHACSLVKTEDRVITERYQ
jgi:hypothetical protein